MTTIYQDFLLEEKNYHNITLMCTRIGLTTNYRSEIITEKDNPFLSKTYDIYKFLKPSLREIFIFDFSQRTYESITKKEWLNSTNNKVKFINKRKEIFSSKIVILDQISTAFFEMLKMDIPF